LGVLGFGVAVEDLDDEDFDDDDFWADDDLGVAVGLADVDFGDVGFVDADFVDVDFAGADFLGGGFGDSHPSSSMSYRSSTELPPAPGSPAPLRLAAATISPTSSAGSSVSSNAALPALSTTIIEDEDEDEDASPVPAAPKHIPATANTAPLSAYERIEMPVAHLTARPPSR
jgi:hypothetical protein